MLNTASARVAAAFTILLLNAEELRHADREEGQALVEYGLILALVAIVCVSLLLALGGRIGLTLTKITNALPGV